MKSYGICLSLASLNSPNNSTSGTTPEETQNSNWKEYMHPCVHCSDVYNSQDMEAAQLPINRLKTLCYICTMEYYLEGIVLVRCFLDCYTKESHSHSGSRQGFKRWQISPKAGLTYSLPVRERMRPRARGPPFVKDQEPTPKAYCFFSSGSKVTAGSG